MINSVSELFELVEKTHSSNHHQVTIVLIGGCARVGKTTLAKELNQLFEKHNINSQIIAMDHWLVSFNKRKPNSKVLDRYETISMISAIKSYMNGHNIQVPHYDPISRKRIAEALSEPVFFKKGVLIIEGVIALAMKELLTFADIKIHINISKCTRLKRLVKYYKNVKKLPTEDYRYLILEREKEEIPFIQQASQNAGIIFNW